MGVLPGTGRPPLVALASFLRLVCNTCAIYLLLIFDDTPAPDGEVKPSIEMAAAIAEALECL